MASNFEETSVSRNAKRTYAKIADIATFTAGVAKFTADTSMGLTKREAGAETYKAKINYFDVNSDDAGYVNMYLSNTGNYDAMITLLSGNEAAETAAGMGAESSHDSAEDTWSTKFSCAIDDDTFTVTITREYILISGFEKDETLAAVEAWADTVAEFGGESA